MGLEREVAGIEEMDYGTGNIAPERLSTPRQENGQAAIGQSRVPSGETSTEALLTRVSIVTEPSGAGYEEVIAAQNRTLEVLSQEIAEAIRSQTR